MMPRAEPGTAATAFLFAAADPARPRLTVRVVIVVAHPDDETLGCGALLPRLENVSLVHATDGAPRSGEDARRHGFADPAAYAAARRRELEAALALAGMRREHATCLGIADQGAAAAIAEIARRLAPMLADAQVVLTHALEGGHPDHDASAVAVRAAARLAGPASAAVIEMPFYRADPSGDGWVRQSFAEASGSVIVRLTEQERRRKLAMLAAHATQAETLRSFGAADEAFRPAVPVEAARLLGGAAAIYDRYHWGVTSAGLQEHAEAALRALGLADRWL